MVTLEERRKRGDLVQMFRTVSCKEKVNAAWWFRPASVREGAASTWQSSGALNVERNEGRTEIGKHFWSVRVFAEWNSLPDIFKTQPSVNSFKNALDNNRAGNRCHPYQNFPDDSMPG
jgi:hypothetical protein